ncbi:MAG: hypothetical protein GF364_03070, partial [Candidatus Lokiarchaeota archaeon]|nr:hypothetical protein [Candidatus Lokiarchaeota archaeon]
MSTKIRKIKLTPIHVPFNKVVRETMKDGEGGLGMAIRAEEDWLGGDFVICEIEDTEGNVGCSEAFVWLPETGISPEGIITIIKKLLHKYIVNQPLDISKINHRMDLNLARNEVAKGLIDLACYDLLGKNQNKRVSELFTDSLVERIPLAALVPLADIEKMVELAETFKAMGYKAIRYKLGHSIDNDVEITEALRNALGLDYHLRVDYNQAYSPEEAIKAINAIEPYNIGYAEQPVAKDDFLGMVKVQKNVKIPIMAHESFFSVNDFKALYKLGAVRVLGINSERPGGITRAIEVIDYAQSENIDTVIH